MKRWKKTAAAVSTMAVMVLAAILNPMTAHAWTLEGESSVKNEVWLQDGTQIGTTIQTNYHAGGLTGLVVRNSYEDMLKMFNITEEQAYWGVRPVLYVANSHNGENNIKLMKEYAGTLGGVVLYDYDLLMFKWDGSSNQTVATTTSPVKMTLGINKEDRISGESFALLRLYDGKGTFFYDTDTDPGTLTFETSEFSGSYVLIRYPSGNTPSGAQPNNTSGTASGTPPAPNQTGNTNSELDDVPKTGDSRSEVLWIMLLISLLTAGTAAFLWQSIRNKETMR